MQKAFWIVFGLIIAGMIGLFMLTSDSRDSGLADYDPTEVQLTDHIYGLGDTQFETEAELNKALEGKAVLLEYGDLQCPACAQFFPVLQQIKSDFEDELVVIFRHFPLTRPHPQAMAAHRAAVAAANQGKFWEMHDMLYLRQQQWSGSSEASKIFRGYAEELGLDMERYDEEVNSAAIFDRITVDQDSSASLSITATPTIFVNGERINPPSYEALTKAIEDSLAN